MSARCAAVRTALLDMNQTGGGEYKLLFLLPVFPDTGKVLLLDIDSDGLGSRLSAMGLECVTGSVGDPGKSAGDGEYDLVVAGRMPSGRAQKSRFVSSVGRLLAERGWLVVLSPNRFGYGRLTGKGGGGGSSLGAMKGMMKKMGFSDIRAYSPVPDPANPSAFVSLSGPGSYEFLLGQFPDFVSTGQGPLRAVLHALIRAGIFSRVQNHYAVVAGERGRVQERG
jgi:hypothetical protein